MWVVHFVCVCKPAFLRLMCQHAMRVALFFIAPRMWHLHEIIGTGLGRKVEVFLFFILGILSDKFYLAVTNDISDHE